jgi:hypothetical protein
MPFIATRMAPLLLAVFAFSGCVANPIPDQILVTDSISAYEGLPHHMYELELAATEIKSKPTITLYNFPFYEETLSFKKEDVAKLIAILGESANFKPLRYEMECGGFHPDFAIEWKSKAGEFTGLICFGCGEYRIFRTSKVRRYYMVGTCREDLAKILSTYRKNRPAHEGWGKWQQPKSAVAE